MKRVVVRKHERGLLLRYGDFDRILRHGTYWLYEGLDTMTVELFTLVQPAFTHRLADYLMAKEPAVVAAEFGHVVLGEDQVGLRTENRVLVEILPPATRRLYWKDGLVDVAVEKIDLGVSSEVPAALMPRLFQSEGQAGAIACLAGVRLSVVPDYGVGVLWVNGRIDHVLPPGRHAFWRFNRDVDVQVTDLRLQTMEVSGQEILTREKVALRLKELETLERVAERIDRISVFGGLDQVLSGLVKLR